MSKNVLTNAMTKANQKIILLTKETSKKDTEINNLKMQINDLSKENECLVKKLYEKDSEIIRLCNKLSDIEYKLLEYEHIKKNIYEKIENDFINLLESIQYMMGYENALKKGHAFSEDEISYSYNLMIIAALQKLDYSNEYLRLLSAFKKIMECYVTDKNAFMKIMFPLYCDLLYSIKPFSEKKIDMNTCTLNIKEILSKYNIDIIFYESATDYNKKLYFNKGNDNTIPIPILIIDGKYENMFSDTGVYREY